MIEENRKHRFGGAFLFGRIVEVEKCAKLFCGEGCLFESVVFPMYAEAKLCIQNIG
jgi:hypothetical protein